MDCIQIDYLRYEAMVMERVLSAMPKASCDSGSPRYSSSQPGCPLQRLETLGMHLAIALW